MSETVTIGGSYTATIYGTLVAAIEYAQTQFGSVYTSWLALSADDQKRTLAGAARFLDRQSWAAAYDTFAERDAVTAFQFASYELAAAAAADESVLTAADAGTTVSSVSEGGSSISFFGPSRSAGRLPPIVQDLLGAYLASVSMWSTFGGAGESGDADNPFATAADYDRTEPY